MRSRSDWAARRGGAEPGNLGTCAFAEQPPAAPSSPLRRRRGACPRAGRAPLPWRLLAWPCCTTCVHPPQAPQYPLLLVSGVWAVGEVHRARLPVAATATPLSSPWGGPLPGLVPSPPILLSPRDDGPGDDGAACWGNARRDARGCPCRRCRRRRRRRCRPRRRPPSTSWTTHAKTCPW